MERIIDDWDSACHAVKTVILGKSFNTPTRCRNAGLNEVAEWDVLDPSCAARFDPPQDQGRCQNFRRVYSARLWDASGDWGDACRATAATIDGASVKPSRCIDKRTEGMWGEFDVNDGRCAQPHIFGTITYTDLGTASCASSGAATCQRPASEAEVELWACGNWVGEACSWSRLLATQLDLNGHFDVRLNESRPKDLFAVRLTAANRAAIVMRQDLPETPFWVELHPARALTKQSSDIDVSRSFGTTGADAFAGGHYNLASKALTISDFARARRDPQEGDQLGRVRIKPSSANKTPFMNSGVIWLHPDRFWDDWMLAHEWFHFFQESVGAYFPWLSVHNDCTERRPKIFGIGGPTFDGSGEGPLVNSKELAFMEGSAEAFAYATHHAEPHRYAKVGRSLERFTTGSYAPYSCDVIGGRNALGAMIGPDATEGMVISVLTRVISPADLECTGTAVATCKASLVGTRAGHLIAILDREFDHSTSTPKNIIGFRRSWVARGHSSTTLDAMLAAYGL